MAKNPDADLLVQIGAAEGSANRLRRLWETERASIEAAPVEKELFKSLANGLIEAGEAWLGLAVCEAGLTALSRHSQRNQLSIPLRCLSALAQARLGAQPEANRIAKQLYTEHPQDVGIICVLARTHKDAGMVNLEAEPCRKELRESRRLYLEAYGLHGAYYAGINAATVSLFLDDRDEARRLALEVLEKCDRAKPAEHEKYWVAATKAEALLLLEERLDEALAAYRHASDLFNGRIANLSTSRRQARLILNRLGQDASLLDSAFEFPKLAIFAGHMIDAEERQVPRFVPEMESEVRQSLLKSLRCHKIGFGVSSVAAGSDVLFAEVLIEIGGEVHVILPWAKEEFLKSSVRNVLGPPWEPRVERILERAASVTTLSQQTLPSGAMSFEWGNECMIGLGIVRARVLDCDCMGVAVYDGRGGEAGGTASFVKYFQTNPRFSLQLITLPNPEAFAGAAALLSKGSRRRFRSFGGVAVSSNEQAIKAVLFADVVGFRKVRESHLTVFVSQFLGRISGLIDDAGKPESRGKPPIITNTWGDAVYLVFDTVRDAGIFALKLRDLVVDTDWTTFNLPSKMNIRIGLHAGPVFICVDPVIRQMTFTGAHVIHAARIESTTVEGQIYASEAFAALTAAQNVEEFICDYIGKIDLAKNYGTFATYRLRHS